MGWKEVLQVLLFVLSWVPVGVLAGTTVFGVAEVYSHDFSIYNEDTNGLSNFHDNIIAQNYEVLSVQSTMSTLSRYGGNATLIIMGPVVDFSLDAVLVIYQHMMAGGGVLIADDFGTANSSFFLLNSLLAGAINIGVPGVNISGVLSFAGGVLYDLDSYDKNPRLPIIRDFTPGVDGGALTQGVSELHLNWASTLTPRSLLGYLGIAWTTNRAWCESNITDPNPWPDHNELNGRLPVAGAVDLSGMNPDAGRLVAVSDPSIFINDMWDRFAGNQRFAMNIIGWLSDYNSEHPVVFCENLLAVPWDTPEFFFGLYLGRALWLSSMPILSAAYPLVTLLGIRKYLPDPKKPEVKSVSDVFMRRGQTYFSERLTYYRSEGNYGRVVKMLYRKMRRALVKKYQWGEYDSRRVWDLIR
ncbi:MAG: DUF4350 domain-containing protein, partial [Candidatus Hodarchaeota archaeon]